MIIRSAGNARFCIVWLMNTCIWDIRIISLKIMIPKIARIRFQVNDFFRIER